MPPLKTAEIHTGKNQMMIPGERIDEPTPVDLISVIKPKIQN